MNLEELTGFFKDNAAEIGEIYVNGEPISEYVEKIPQEQIQPAISELCEIFGSRDSYFTEIARQKCNELIAAAKETPSVGKFTKNLLAERAAKEGDTTIKVQEGYL